MKACLPSNQCTVPEKTKLLPYDVVCALIDKDIIAVIPPIAPENEHDIKLMENLQKHAHSD